MIGKSPNSIFKIKKKSFKKLRTTETFQSFVKSFVFVFVSSSFFSTLSRSISQGYSTRGMYFTHGDCYRSEPIAAYFLCISVISKYTFFYALFFFLSACDDLRCHTYIMQIAIERQKKCVEQSPLSNSAVPLHRRLNYFYVFISITHMCIRFQYPCSGGSGI